MNQFATSGRSLDSDPGWRRRDLLLSILLVIAVVAVWLTFRG